MNIWKSTKAVADPGEGPGGPAPPPPAYFQTKLRPEGPKINFGDRPPPPPPSPLSQGLDLALLKYTKRFFLLATRFRKRTVSTE